MRKYSKEFKKSYLNVIIAFILGILLSGGIVYAATSASQVTYKDGKTVEYALNDLYNKSNVKLSKKVIENFYYAAGNVQDPYYGTKTFDVKDKLPNYSSLTKENFCLQINSTAISKPGGSDVSANGVNISITSYENGILTVDLPNTVRSGTSPYINISIIAFYLE